MRTLGAYLGWKLWGRKPTRKAPRRRKSFVQGPIRDARYIKWIRTLPCVVCGRTPSEAAHTGTDGGQSLKSSDSSCIPLCTNCHTMCATSYHNLGRNEFERVHGVNTGQIVSELNVEWSDLRKWR
jgi:hypothetical protein